MRTIHTVEDADQYVSEGIAPGARQLLALYVDVQELKERIGDALEKAKGIEGFPTDVIEDLTATQQSLDRDDFSNDLLNAVLHAMQDRAPEIK